MHPRLNSPSPWTLSRNVGGEAQQKANREDCVMDVDTVKIPRGWRLTLGDSISIDAVDAYLDRTAIKAALSIRNCEAIYLKDTVNLTSARARQRIIEKLVQKGLTDIEDGHLMALEEACRQRPNHDTASEKKNNVAGSSDTSEKVAQLIDLQNLITSFLLLGDPDALALTLGAMAAHRLGGSPVWLLLVAPPSGTKTEIIRALGNAKGVYPYSVT
jgi:hypothetical protein